MEKFVQRILMAYLSRDAYFVVKGPCTFLAFAVQFGRTSVHAAHCHCSSPFRSL
jgi:hypothetical protein